MILATSKTANSPTKIRETADEFSKKLRQRVIAFKAHYDAAQVLGLQLSTRSGAFEFWFQGFGRAEDGAESKAVMAVVKEWADGDSIAAHYGYGMDLFCSDDCGKSASSPSILDQTNRQWLSERFGIRFVTLAQLSLLVRQNEGA
jgi:hypothetical protein